MTEDRLSAGSTTTWREKIGNGFGCGQACIILSQPAQQARNDLDMAREDLEKIGNDFACGSACIVVSQAGQQARNDLDMAREDLEKIGNDFGCAPACTIGLTGWTTG